MPILFGKSINSYETGYPTQRELIERSRESILSATQTFNNYFSNFKIIGFSDVEEEGDVDVEVVI